MIRMPAPLALFGLILLVACGGGGGDGGAEPPPVVLPAPPPPVGEWPEPALASPTTPVTTVARITRLPSTVAPMAPCIVHVHATDSELAAGALHTARFVWKVAGPTGWQPAKTADPRPGLQRSTQISSDLDCEGFNYALLADVPGKYTIGLEVWDEAGAIAVARSYVEVLPDTRTRLYVSGSGSDISGAGTLSNPWREPARAWKHLIANGKSDFSIQIERGHAYGGVTGQFDKDIRNLVVDAYGTGASPILRWSNATYPGGQALFSVGASEGVLLRGLALRGNDADNIHASAIEIDTKCTNVGFVHLTFGGPGDSDGLHSAITTHADEDDTGAIPTRQHSGLAFFNCSGHTDAYFFFSDCPQQLAYVDSSTFPATRTEFEIQPHGLGRLDDLYNGMTLVFAGRNSNANMHVRIQDYVGNNGNGRPKVILAEPLNEVPLGDGTVYAFVADITRVGDSDIFMFGCDGSATNDLGTEARIRIMNATRGTFVGTKMGGGSAGEKEGFRLMIHKCYLHRCTETTRCNASGGIGSSGISPFRNIVLDRCWLGTRDNKDGIVLGIAGADGIMVRGCVLSSTNPSPGYGDLIDMNYGLNDPLRDARVVHCTLLTRRAAPAVSAVEFPWSTSGQVSLENNLVVAGDAGNGASYFMDWRKEGLSIFKSVKNNVWCGITTTRKFYYIGQYITLEEWLAKPEIDGDALGTSTLDALVAAAYVPADAGGPERSNRSFTSTGYYQDYYGADPRGYTWVGAVSRPPP